MIEILVCFADLPLCSVRFIKELWNLQIYLCFFLFHFAFQVNRGNYQVLSGDPFNWVCFTS